MNSPKNCLNEVEYHIRQVEKKFIYKWVIHDFSCLKAKKLKLPSTSFKVQCGQIFPITGTLSITGTCYDRHCILSLAGGPTNFSVDAVVWVKEDGKQKAITMTLGNQNTAMKKPLHQNVHSTVLQSCFLCKGNCTIICELTSLDYVEYEVPKPEIKETTFLTPDKELFTNKKHYDVTFNVLGQNIRAHKCILASRNEVFAAMFEHEMQENQTNFVKIDDIDPEVFDDILCYIYTGEVMHLKKFTSELLAASEKYNIQNLKMLCAHELCSNITIENAAEALILADKYRVDELKTAVIAFISAKRPEVAKTEGWKKVVASNADLLAELYLKL